MLHAVLHDPNARTGLQLHETGDERCVRRFLVISTVSQCLDQCMATAPGSTVRCQDSPLQCICTTLPLSLCMTGDQYL